jgi:predicted metalloprotease with PDZ domain
VAESSFDAWVKYYRQDENTANATVSYYTKGSLIALLLDLRLRATGEASLDDVMRGLWAACPDGGVTEAAILAQVEALAGPMLRLELLGWVHGRGDLPLNDALAANAVNIGADNAAWAAGLGLRLSEGPVTGIVVKSVLQGSAAAEAGLSAGDELLAVEGWRVRRFEDARQWVAPDQPFEVLLSRQQKVRSVRITPQAEAPLAATCALTLNHAAPAPAQALRKAWIGT